MTVRTGRALALLVAAALGGIAGCSADSTAGVDPAAAERTGHAGHGSGTHAMPDGTAMADEEMPPGTGHAGHGGEGLAMWATQTSGGTVLVLDGEGRPFYRSDTDRPAPTCAGACAAGWEPVTVADGETPELLGVARSAVGAVRRDDGATQLTLGGAPLYRHAGPVPVRPDPGGYAAQGWHMVTPRGERVRG